MGAPAATPPAQASYSNGGNNYPTQAPESKPAIAQALGSPAAPAASKPLTTADVLDRTSPSVGAVWRGTGEDVSAAAAKGEYGRAAGLGIRGGLALFPAAIADTVAKPANSVAHGVGGFVDGLRGVTVESTPTTKPTPAQASYSNEGHNYPTRASTAVSPIRAAGATPTNAAPVDLGQGRDVGFGIRRFDAPGQSPLFTNKTDAAGMEDNQALMGRGAPTAQNLAAMNAMLERGASERAAQRAQQQFAAEAAQAQASTAAGLQVAQGIDARLQADSQARTNLMDMRQKMGESTQDYEARTRAMTDAQRLAATQSNTRAGLGLNREMFAAARQDSQAKFGMDRQHLEMARQRAANELANGAVGREEKSFGILSAKQLLDIQSRYLASNDPNEKARLSQTLRELSGKPAPADWAVQVTPTTKNLDGSTSMGSIYKYNKATGDVQQVDGGAPRVPTSGSISVLKSDPSLAADFDQYYGVGASAKYLTKG